MCDLIFLNYFSSNSVEKAENLMKDWVTSNYELLKFSLVYIFSIEF